MIYQILSFNNDCRNRGLALEKDLPRKRAYHKKTEQVYKALFENYPGFGEIVWSALSRIKLFILQ